MGKIVDTPFGTKISGILKEGIEFYWKKVEHASGYEVYRAYSEDGEYEKIAHIPKRNIGTYVDEEFDHNKKTVFYNVRSFVDVENGERIFSPMAKPAEAIFVERLTLERSVTYMYADSTRVLLPSYGWGEPDDLMWSSDNEAVATVENNVITAIAKGETTIRCTCRSTGYYKLVV